MKLSSEHREHLADILRWRRDIRHFSTDAIDPQILEQIEASVDFAPSVGNSRPWRFVRVNDAEKRSSVAKTFESENRRASLIYDDPKREKYVALKLAGLREAPVHYAVFTDADPAEGCGLGRQTMPETLTYSTVMAIHTLWLAARALNVGVGWVSILDPAIMNAILDVPQKWKFTAYLCVGYPLEYKDTPELERRGWQVNVPSVWTER
ncbi:5,6-dimethylbenzimidazole synthase [Hoeflea sp. TYP-13]|uniref:5,6-dimethylbenzimidazole synthase n=1 Tax=Hoeflea sp. TYP-13 TaxID=3230023 RepID=UPI0034C6152E